MDLRVEALAAQVGVSVDTVRYYQARGLLHPPRRQGRVAWYDDSHLDRLRRVRALQARGFPLATIARVLAGQLDAADEALVGALAEESAPDGPGSLLTLDELATRTGIPAAVLRALEREGLLVPRQTGEATGFGEDDVAAAQAGLAILHWGIPLSDLLDLAAAHHRALVELADRAVELFDTHIRHAAREDPAIGPDEAAGRMVEAFHTLLPAAATLVGHHFTRLLLQQAINHVTRVEDGSLPATAQTGDAQTGDAPDLPAAQTGDTPDLPAAQTGDAQTGDAPDLRAASPDPPVAADPPSADAVRVRPGPAATRGGPPRRQVATAGRRRG